jgi:hypothetical protein
MLKNMWKKMNKWLRKIKNREKPVQQKIIQSGEKIRGFIPQANYTDRATAACE